MGCRRSPLKSGLGIGSNACTWTQEHARGFHGTRNALHVDCMHTPKYHVEYALHVDGQSIPAIPH